MGRGLFVDEKGALVKSVEQGGVLDHTPNIEEKKELMIPHSVLTVYKNNATFRLLHHKMCLFQSLSFHTVFHLTVYMY